MRMKRRMIRGLSFEPESDRPLSPPRRVTPPKRTAAARDKKTKLSTGTRATALCRARPDSRMTRRRDCPAGRQVRRIRSPMRGNVPAGYGKPRCPALQHSQAHEQPDKTREREYAQAVGEHCRERGLFGHGAVDFGQNRDDQGRCSGAHEHADGQPDP